ncbi:MAG: 23S rRNA (adenine(2503)-C(2))-methyltransferase RlmN [Syntrophobacteraceae bacterium]
MKLFALTCTDLAHELGRRYGKGLHHAAALYREAFKQGNDSFIEAPELLSSPAFLDRLATDLRFPSCRIASLQEDGGVVKFASTLCDELTIESVIIPGSGRTTLCVSSQVGCRMGCAFCTTGQMGFARNLETEEIVWQVHAARFALGYRIDNVVFMGMGEPLDNFDNVIQAVRVLSDQRGLDLALSHMTLSTAGHVDGLDRLAALSMKKLRLAVSLNAADNSLRSSLMPINRKFPLEPLAECLRRFPLARNGVVFIEYVLLAGVNDSREAAMQLIGYLAELPPARVNLIPYNGDVPSRYDSPPPEQVSLFARWLTDARVFTRIRQSHGRSIMAGCGQLGASLVSKNPGSLELA